MMGQLAKNIRIDSQDQEAFVIGFYCRRFYIAHGYFRKDLISQVHSKGCTADETIEIQFTRGYNLSLREDWFEVVVALATLLRYIVSGNAKIGASNSFLK